jgi:hypothetical protein
LWDAVLDGSALADGLFRYSVFIANDRMRAIVIMNLEEQRSICAQIDVPQAQSVMIATPEQPEAQATGTSVNIPAHSAVIVMEI